MFTGDINIVLTGLAHTVSSAPGMRLAGKPVTSHHELVTRKPKGTWGFFLTSAHTRLRFISGHRQLRVAAVDWIICLWGQMDRQGP